jgi:hypothetical protein
LDVDLSEEFFARRMSTWSRPSEATASLVRGAIVHEVNARSATTIVGPPHRDDAHVEEAVAV